MSACERKSNHPQNLGSRNLFVDRLQRSPGTYWKSPVLVVKVLVEPLGTYMYVHFCKTGRYILGGVRLVCCCTIRMYVADTMPVPANLHREKTWTRASSYPHHSGGTSRCRLSTSICQTRGSAHHNNKEVRQSLDPQTLSERVEAGVCSAEFSQNSAPSAASRFDLRSELPSLQADILCFR